MDRQKAAKIGGGPRHRRSSGAPGWLSATGMAESPPGWLSRGRRRKHGRSRLREVPGMSAKTKDPSGGTTGRVKPYGRLGWMGARAEYSLDGEGLPLPLALVAEGHPDVQRWFENFFGSPGRHFGRRLCVSASNLRAFGGFSVTATENAAPPKDAAIAIWTPGSFVERERRGHSSSPRVSSARCQSHSPAIRVDRREKLLQGTYRRHTEPFVEIHGGGIFVSNRRILPGEIGVGSKRVVNHAGIARTQRAICVPGQQHFDFTGHSFSQSIVHCHHRQPRSTPAASAVRPVSCVHRTGAPLRFSPIHRPSLPPGFTWQWMDRRSRGVLPLVRSSTYATHHSTCMAS
jgi:hypothetical protein